MNECVAILSNIVLVVAALGLGRSLQRLFPEGFSQLDRWTFTLLGGLGLLGIALFLLGQFWFSRWGIISVLLVGIGIGLKNFARIISGFRTTLAKVKLPLLPTIVIAMMLLVTAIGGLALPTGDMNNDSIAYHYLGPKVWLRDRQIRPVPDEVFTAFPAVVETQYAALMSLGGQRAPGFFAVTSLIAILLVTASLAVRLGLSESGAWWAAALIVTMAALYRGAYGGFIDVVVAAFILGAARIGLDAEERRQYVLFGILCGIAMAAKYTAIIPWILLVLCSLWISLIRHNGKADALRNLSISCLVAVAVASPFYLRNWIFFGCPIYPPPPLLLRFFTVKVMLPSVLHEIERNVRTTGKGMGRGLREFLLLPFNLTYHTANFRGAGGIGLAPLALGPIGVVASRINVFARGLAMFAVLQVAAWFATAQESRYLIAIYVIASLFAVLGWQYIAREGSKYAKVLSAVVVASSIAYGLAMIIPARFGDLRAAVSHSFEAKRMEQEIPFLESFHYLNADPSVKKVLILDAYMPAYYLDKAYIKPRGRWGEETLSGLTDPRETLPRLSELSVTHVLDVSWEGEEFSLRQRPPKLTLVFWRSGQRVYRVD